MDNAIPVLAEDALIRVGGWDPRYARVLLIEDDGQNAVVLIDGNGDGAELELEYWHRDSDGTWRGGSTSGHGSLATLPDSERWNAGEFVAAIGRAEPGGEISLEYAGCAHSRRVSQFGVWGFVHAADAARPADLPTVTPVHPLPE